MLAIPMKNFPFINEKKNVRVEVRANLFYVMRLTSFERQWTMRYTTFYDGHMEIYFIDFVQFWWVLLVLGGNGVEIEQDIQKKRVKKKERKRIIILWVIIFEIDTFLSLWYWMPKLNPVVSSMNLGLFNMNH